MAQKTVLVTGADGALGSFVTKRYLEGGWRVIGTHLLTQKHPENPPGVIWTAVDLGRSDSVRDALRGLGSIDALVHCAGGFRFANIDQISDADIDFLINVNLRSTLYLLRELVAGMKSRDFGRIVLVGARATSAPTGGMGAYAATKAGINALVSSVADETRSKDITINAVLPTIIDTPANRRDMPKADFNAWVKPEKLADIIFSLTGEVGSPINGALIPIAGRL